MQTFNNRLFKKMNFLYFLLFLIVPSSIYSQSIKDKVLENYILLDEFEKAKIYTLSKLKRDSTGYDYAYYNAKAGFVFLRLGVLDSAMFYSNKAVHDLSNTTPDEIKFEAWKSLAYTYTRFGKLDSAIVYTQKLFTSVENTDNFEMRRYAHALMGIINFQNKLFTESLSHYQKALELSLLANNNTNLMVDYYNIGLTQTALKKYEEGIASLLIAESYALESKDKTLLARIYGTTADNYASQNNDENRQFYLNKANEIAQQIKDEKLIAMGQSHQLEWDFKNNKSTKAYTEGEKVVENIKKQDLPHIQLKGDSMMYVLAKENNDMDKALFYLESFYQNKIQLLNENGKKQLAEIEASYELKNKNLIIQKKELELIASKRVNKITFLITTICFLLLLFYAYSNYKNKKLVHLIYKKEKEKDHQIIKLQERISLANEDKYSLVSNIFNDELNKDSILEEANLNDKKLFEIYQKLMQLLEIDKLYLNLDLSQSVVIRLLGTNKKYLYESISKYSDLNFRGIINRLRINEAKLIIRNRISSQKELNFSSIFSECGFNSNSSFYRTFKAITGITPNEYAEEFRKDYSNRSIT